MGLYQIKKLCRAKEIHQQNEKQPMEYENIFAKHISDKGLIIQYIKKKKTNTNQKQTKNITIQFLSKQRN